MAQGTKGLKGTVAIMLAVLAGGMGCTRGVVGGSPPASPKPYSRAVGVFLGLPELIALRYQAGLDRRVGIQANIGPFFGSVDIRFNKASAGGFSGYGLLGAMALMPWVEDIVGQELGSPAYGLEFGAGLERVNKKGRTIGAEFAIVLPLEEESGTAGMRFGVYLMYRR